MSIKNKIRKFPLISFFLLKKREIQQLYRVCMLHLNGSSVLKHINLIFEQKKLQYWLEFGTLLGAYRQNDYLKNDDDLDIGVLLENQQSIQSVLINNGFKRKYWFVFNGMTIAERYNFKQIGIDIHYFLQEESIFYTYILSQNYPAVDNICDVIKYSYKNYSTFKPYNFKNAKTYVPTKIELVLAEKYGPNWDKPESKWDFKMSPVTTILQDKGIILHT